MAWNIKDIENISIFSIDPTEGPPPPGIAADPATHARGAHRSFLSRFPPFRFVRAAGSQIGSVQEVLRRIGNAIIGGDFTGNARGDYALDLQVFRSDALSVASGLNAIAVGNQLTASGAYSVALGFASQATGQNATAVGSYAEANLQDEFFIGGRFISTLESGPAGPATPTAPTTRIWFNGVDHRIYLRSQTINAPLMYDGQAAGGSLSGAFPNPGVVWANGYATYDARYMPAGSAAPVGSAFVTVGNDATLSAERALVGTANQVIVTDGGANGNVTLSTPQNIHTGASPTFAGLTLNISASMQINQGTTDYIGVGVIRSGGATTLITNDATNGYVFVTTNHELKIGTNNLTRVRVPNAGGLVVGTAALATTATDGFLYVPTCAGAPTGTPTAQTGTAALVYDTTNNQLWVRNGAAWKQATLS